MSSETLGKHETVPAQAGGGVNRHTTQETGPVSMDLQLMQCLAEGHRITGGRVSE